MAMQLSVFVLLLYYDVYKLMTLNKNKAQTDVHYFKLKELFFKKNLQFLLFLISLHKRHTKQIEFIFRQKLYKRCLARSSLQ